MRFFGVILAALIGIIGTASAQSWPGRPIRWIVPYPPGGGTDITARLVADKLTKQLGQSVIIDNRPGGNTIIGTTAMVQSPTDGHTIGLITDAFSANIALERKMPYDPLNDLVPVVQLLEVPFVLIVNPSLVPMRTLPDLISHAKANPGWLTLGSLGPGSPHDSALTWFTHMTGVDALIVPYRGGGPAMQDLLAGQVKGMMYGSSSALEMIKAGKVYPIAVTSHSRLDSLPNVPTVREQGYPDYIFSSFFGVVAPAHTQPAVVDRLNREINIALKAPEVSDQIVLGGSILVGGPASNLDKLIRDNIDRYRKIFALGGVKPQ